MAALQATPELSSRAQLAFRKFRAVLHQFDTSSTDGSSDKPRLSRDVIEDAYERYKLWSGPLGALHPAKDPRSLEYRFRNAPHVKARTCELLDELLGLLDATVSDHVSYPTGKTNSSFLAADDEDEALISEILDLKTSAECQDSWLQASLADVIRRLFRVSRLVTKATTTDRHAKAEASQDEKLDDTYDIAHVREKFGKRRSQESSDECSPEDWLIERLGKSITKRRQFFLHCRNHNERMEKPQGPILQRREALGTESRFGKQSLVFTSPSDGKTHPSKVQTTASSLGPLDLNVVDDGFDDTRSVSTMATWVRDDINENALQIPRLSDFASPGEDFECPFCLKPQIFNGQRGWEKHLFADMTPYVCTFEDCPLTMFADRRTWADHEMQKHRRTWRCQLCSEKTIDSRDQLREHVRMKHPALATSSHFEIFLDTCSYPLETITSSSCPLCDWQAFLRAKKKNSHLPPDEVIYVTAPQFMRHLSGHLEQLALFALPKLSTHDRDSMDSKEQRINSEQRTLSGRISDTTSTADHETPRNPKYTNARDLERACAAGNLEEVVEMLNMDLETIGIDWFRATSCLTAAAAAGHDGIVEILTNHTDFVHGFDSALMEGVKNGHVRVAKALLDAGGNFDQFDIDRWTPLMFSSYRGYVEIVKLLIDVGADRNLRNHDGNTALMLASTRGFVEIAILLVKAGVGLEALSDHENLTALSIGARAGHTEVVRALLDAGANANSTDSRGNTPLIFAATNEHVDTVDVLLGAGADLYHRNHEGLAAIDVVPAGLERANIRVSPAKKDQKQVVFELLVPNATFRVPSRAMISTFDTTESIVTTVKNIYGLYEHDVSFEDKDGISMTATYDNFEHDMIVYVRAFEQKPSLPTAHPVSPVYPKQSALGAPLEILSTAHNVESKTDPHVDATMINALPDTTDLDNFDFDAFLKQDDDNFDFDAFLNPDNPNYFRGNINEALGTSQDAGMSQTAEHLSLKSIKDKTRVQKHPAMFECHLCPKRFTRAYNLSSHLRTHTDERPFVCTVCGMGFMRQRDRKRHEALLHDRGKIEEKLPQASTVSTVQRSPTIPISLPQDRSPLAGAIDAEVPSKEQLANLTPEERHLILQRMEREALHKVQGHLQQLSQSAPEQNQQTVPEDPQTIATRRRAIEALNDFLADIKRRANEPHSHHDDGQRMQDSHLALSHRDIDGSRPDRVPNDANYKDYVCCGILLPTMHDLVKHYEKVHGTGSMKMMDSKMYQTNVSGKPTNVETEVFEKTDSKPVLRSGKEGNEDDSATKGEGRDENYPTTARLPPESKPNYPSREDWQRHRTEIFELYKDRPLKEVMKIMEEKHGFFATKRMYDTRFRQWGVSMIAKTAEKKRMMSSLFVNSASMLELACVDTALPSKLIEHERQKRRELATHPAGFPDSNRNHVDFTLLPQRVLASLVYTFGSLFTTPPELVGRLSPEMQEAYRYGLEKSPELVRPTPIKSVNIILTLENRLREALLEMQKETVKRAKASASEQQLNALQGHEERLQSQSALFAAREASTGITPSGRSLYSHCEHDLPRTETWSACVICGPSVKGSDSYLTGTADRRKDHQENTMRDPPIGDNDLRQPLLRGNQTEAMLQDPHSAPPKKRRVARSANAATQDGPSRSTSMPPTASYQCEHCDRTFSRADNMRDHMRRIHQDPKKNRGETLSKEDRESLQTILDNVHDSLQDLEEESNDPDLLNRGIIDPFLDLPPRSSYPDYYELIKQPICMKQIETKINKKQYQGLREFRQDIALLCSNCRQYNEDGSMLYDDANLIERTAIDRLREEAANYPEWQEFDQN